MHAPTVGQSRKWHLRQRGIVKEGNFPELFVDAKDVVRRRRVPLTDLARLLNEFADSALQCRQLLDVDVPPPTDFLANHGSLHNCLLASRARALATRMTLVTG